MQMKSKTIQQFNEMNANVVQQNALSTQVLENLILKISENIVNYL